MADREKVITGLEICTTRNGTCQYKQEPICPYVEHCRKEDYAALQRDVLALLKEDDAIIKAQQFVLNNACEKLKEQEEQIKNRDESLEKAREEIIKWLRGMLKEPEPVEPILKCEGWNKYHNYYVCPRCDDDVFYEQNYCSECGLRFLWKEGE